MRRHIILLLLPILLFSCLKDKPKPKPQAPSIKGTWVFFDEAEQEECKVSTFNTMNCGELFNLPATTLSFSGSIEFTSATYGILTWRQSYKGGNPLRREIGLWTFWSGTYKIKNIKGQDYIINMFQTFKFWIKGEFLFIEEEFEQDDKFYRHNYKLKRVK